MRSERDATKLGGSGTEWLGGGDTDWAASLARRRAGEDEGLALAAVGLVPKENCASLTAPSTAPSSDKFVVRGGGVTSIVVRGA